MLRTDRRPKPERDLHPPSKPTSKFKSEKPPASSSLKPKQISKPLISRQGCLATEHSRGKDRRLEKENKADNQNTPKLQETIDHQMNSDEMDQLSQIKFISKECSSIKENQYDVDFNSENHLEDFSPLFDRQTLKDDFILEIQDISETDLFSEKNHSIRKNNILSQRNYQFSKQKTLNQRQSVVKKLSFDFNAPDFRLAQGKALFPEVASGKGMRGGRIKRNKPDCINSLGSTLEFPRKEPKAQAKIQSKIEPKDWIKVQIQHLFEILNAKGEKALSQSNCRSEVLSTELNYLIGSILNKIKVRGKSYTYTEFSEEFRGIVEDSDAQELKEILNFGGSEIAEELKEQDVSFEASATFSEPKPLVPDLNLKINRISQKLSSYLTKNKLSLEKPQEDLKDTKASETGPQSAVNSMASSKIQPQEFIQHARQSVSVVAERTVSLNSIANETIKTEYSLRNGYEVVKGMDGQKFSLVFTELNKHLQ